MAEGERQASSRIFISYRREDSAGFVRALLGPLRQRFGSDRIFKDTDNIPPGEDFLNAIQRELESCKVLLAVIGSEWMTVEDPRTRKRRLDNPKDYLRLEVATALRNEHVVVIPVLVDRAGMPGPDDLPEDLGPLARRNAIELSDSRWDVDVERLVHAIEGICNDPALEEEVHVDARPREPGEPARFPSLDSSGGFERLELKRKRQIAEHLAAARQAFEIQDFEAVLAACESAIWLDPQEPEARDLTARARSALDERQIQEWLAEAGQALAKGELAAASEAIDQALARIPTHPGAVKLRQDLLRARQERDRRREADRLVAAEITSARSRFEEEDFSAALSHVEDAIALAPDFRDAQELKAQIVAARDEWQRARELKRRAQQAVTAAQAEFAAGQYDAALSRLEQFAPPHDLVARALADLRQQAEQAQETARLEKAARDAEAAAELAKRERDEQAAREETARVAAAAKARQEQIEQAKREETARREKTARDAEAAAELARREREEQAAREEAARVAAAEKARQEQIEQAKRERAARLAAEAAELARGQREARAALEEVARVVAAEKARQEQIEQEKREEAAARAAREEARRREEETRKRDEEARKLEQAVAAKLDKASKVDDHEVALALLNEALTLAPVDQRIHTQIARHDAALKKRRAEEQRRQADEARRLAETRKLEEETRRREEESRKREESIGRILTKASNEPVDELAIGLLNDGLRIAPHDPRLQTLVGERKASLERKRVEALEKAASEEALRRDQERRAREQKTRREREEREVRAQLALEKKAEQTEGTSERGPVSFKYLGAAAAVVIAIVAVGFWLAQSPAPDTIAQPSDAVRESVPPTNAPDTGATGATPTAASPATGARGGTTPASSPDIVGRGAPPPASSPATVARGTTPPARSPGTVTRGNVPPARSPATGTRGTAPVGSPPESVTAVVPAAGPPSAAPSSGATASATPPPAAGTTAATAPAGARLAAERTAIQQLLDRYVIAYSRMDERSLKTLDPSFRGIPRRELIRSVTLTLDDAAIDISPDGQSARLRASGDYRYVWNRAGLPPTSPARWTWVLRKVGTTWTVVP